MPSLLWARLRPSRLALAGVLLLIACGHHAGTRARGHPLTILYPGDERTFGPYWDMPAKFAVFLPMVRLDEHGELQGVLARSWEHSDDYRHWTIHLRNDVRWHDGVPFTARDVEFTFDLLADSAVLWEPPGAVDVRVVDDSTVALTFRKRTDSPLDTWRVYYPRHLLDTLDRSHFYEWSFWAHPVGDGPYRVVREVPKTMVELEANRDYYAGKPAIDDVVLKFASQGASGLPELLAGNVDVLGWAGRLDAIKLAKDDRFRVYYDLDAIPRAVLWNARLPQLADARVRRALTLAINRRELSQTLGLPGDVPIVDGPVTARQFRRHDYPPPLPYDTLEARRLLDASGWRRQGGQGVRERAGVPLRFTLIVAGEVREAGVYVQAALARVGVDARVSTLDLNVVRQRIRSGTFDAILAFVHPARDRAYFGPEGVTHLHDVRLAALVDAADRAIDPDRRDSVFREIDAVFRDEQPATFLIPGVNEFVAPRWLKGLRSPWNADPIVNLAHLWIEGEAP